MYYHWGHSLLLYFKICFTQSFVIFLHPFLSPPFTSPISASHAPLHPPLPLFTFLSEWVESSLGMWDTRRAGGLVVYEWGFLNTLLPPSSTSAKVSGSQLLLHRVCSGGEWWCCGFVGWWRRVDYANVHVISETLRLSKFVTVDILCSVHMKASVLCLTIRELWWLTPFTFCSLVQTCW